MTDSASERDDAAQPWWHGTPGGLPDIEAMIGEEGMAAVGTVADEALKLFVVLRERFAVPQTDVAQDAGPAEQQPVGRPWEDMLGQLAAGAVRAVNEFAAGAAPVEGPPSQAPGTAQSGEPAETVVQPGEAAACAYCPICQAIALFRSVPMTTWQRLAASVVEVADAARDVSSAAAHQAGPVVVIPSEATEDSDTVSVADVLADLAAPDEESGDLG